jgi:hypothetical protein
MSRNLTPLSLVAALALTVSAPTQAHEDYSDAGSLHWSQHVQETKSQPTAQQLAPFGYAASGRPDRVIAIDGTSRYVNVTRLETIEFNIGGKRFAWTFDTFGTPNFPLAKIAPRDVKAEGIQVYVAENPIYIN